MLNLPNQNHQNEENNMEGYLGEFDIDIKNTPFAEYTKKDWALFFIGNYGGIDGSHHKDWVMDQATRILHGTPVIVKEARWENGHSEYRITVREEPTLAYTDWVHELREWDEETEEYKYSYEEGICP